MDSLPQQAWRGADAPSAPARRAMVLSGGVFAWSLVESGKNQTIPSEIALNFPEAFGMRLHELIAAGLMLFVITLAVNMIARAIVNKHKEFSGAN